MNLRILSRRSEIKNFFGEEPLIGATVRLTKACNLRCPHCYVNAELPLEDELRFDEIKKVIDELAKLKTFSVFYTGGEPFLRKDIVKILQYTHQKELGISISTNGTLLSKNLLKKIKNIPFELFQISLDGTKEIHESIRGKGVWGKAIEAIKLAKRILKKNIGLGIVLMKRNWKILHEVIYEGFMAGADKFTLLCLILTGRANKSQNLTPKEFLESVKLAFDEYEKLRGKIKIAKDTTIPPALIPEKWRKKGLYKTFAPCSFPYYIAINSNGEIAPCDGLFNCPEMIIGNIRENSLSEIWHKSKLLKELRKIDPSDLKGVCKKCIYKNYCAGGCRAYAYIKYKDFTMPDPVCQNVYEAGLFPKSCLK
jgi:radical SAM protein with 4Fe4S-binding SPASM domain